MRAQDQLKAIVCCKPRAGSWQFSEHQSLPDLEEALSLAHKRSDETCVIHVGFSRPTIEWLEAAEQTHPGKVLLTPAARHALSDQVTVDLTGTSTGAIGTLYISTIVSGGMTYAACIESHAQAEKLDWVQRLSDTDGVVGQVLRGEGIGTDAEYQRLESRLARIIRMRVAIGRYRILTGQLPNVDTLLARLDACPPWLLNLPLSQLDLDTRTARCLRRAGYTHLADLATTSEAALLKLSAFGRKSLIHLRERVFAYFAKGPDTPFPTRTVADQAHLQDLVDVGEAPSELIAGSTSCSSISAIPHGQLGLWGSLEVALNILGDSKAHVLRRRWGLGAEPVTLEQLGRNLGVTRERVRQIESTALQRLAGWRMWEDEFRPRLCTLLAQRKEPLPVVGLDILDPWFNGTAEHTTAFASLIDRFASAAIYVIDIGGLAYVSRISRQDWDETVRVATQLLETSAGRGLIEEDARHLVAAQLPDTAKELVSELWSIASERAYFAEGPRGRVLVSFGLGADQVVKAVLHRSAVPLHYREVARLCERTFGRPIDPRRAHAAAAEVGLQFGRGTYGLAHHLAISTEDQSTLLDVSEEIVEEGEPNRQWHASEIAHGVQERLPHLADSIDQYTISIVLRSSKRLADLGRLAWALNVSDGLATGDRIDIANAVEVILERAGMPLTSAELRERLSRDRGLNQNLRYQIQPTARVLRIATSLWGLKERDVPLSAAEQSHLVAVLKNALNLRGTGIHVSEINSVLLLTDAAYVVERNVGQTIVLSLCQRSDEIRVDHSQYLYMSEWGESRRLSVYEATVTVLAEAGNAGLAFEQIASQVEGRCGREASIASVTQALRESSRSDKQSGRWVLVPVSQTILSNDFGHESGDAAEMGTC